jgi:hypothetical protein
VKVVGSAVAKRRRRKTILPWALAAMRTASTQKNYPHFGHDHLDGKHLIARKLSATLSSR